METQVNVDPSLVVRRREPAGVLSAGRPSRAEPPVEVIRLVGPMLLRAEARLGVVGDAPADLSAGARHQELMEAECSE